MEVIIIKGIIIQGKKRDEIMGNTHSASCANCHGKIKTF